MAKRRDLPVLFLGVRRRTGTDPSQKMQQYGTENLSAYLENGAGWVCGQAQTCPGYEGVGLLMRRSNIPNELTSAKCMSRAGL